MRFLIAGLVLMALGIGFTEYSRRHPSEAEAASAKKSEPKPPPGPPPTMKALVETQPPGPDTPGPREVFEKTLPGLQRSAVADGFTTVLQGAVTMRELHAGAGFAVLVLDEGGGSALVRVSKAEAPRLLAVRAMRVGAVALDGATVFWAEDGKLLSMPADGSAPPSARVELPKASFLSLAARDGLVAAAIGPRDGDPFSTDPTGAVVTVGADGAVKLVAPDVVRPHDVLLDKEEVFYIGGYPSGLYRAALDGSFSARIGERADGPLALDGDGVVHRVPVSSGSELRRIARAGGSSVSLAHVDAALVAASEGTVYFTASGVGARLYGVKAGEEPKDVLALQSGAQGLAVAGGAVWLVVDEGAGSAVRVR